LILVPPATAALLARYTLWLTYWNSVFAVLVVLVGRLIAREGELGKTSQ
jgi:hypothetical protein